MSEQTFNAFLYGWIALAAVLLPVQLVITPPYGRHASPRWGPTIDNRTGWVLMEAISPLALLLPLLPAMAHLSAPVLVFTALWLVHYLHRALVFPLRTRTAGKRIPLLIVLFAVMFNGVNGWTNGYYLASPWADYTASWLADPRFLVGLAIFALGAAINIWAENRLIGLRAHGETGYAIPRGELFERISCPNHLGEIIEWTGFAILCWNLPAAAFAVWTAANLVPRALSHHRWYQARFPDYPTGRKAVIPFLL